jgi:peptide/nickel transport system permease protein
MIRLIIRRIAGAVPLLWGLSTILFLVLHLAPGDPSLYFLDENFPPETRALMTENLGLDESLWVQYWKWLKSAARGDFQLSLLDRQPVSAHILRALPNTLLLSATALLLIFSGGICIGTIQASRQNSLFDHGATAGCLILYSIPGFLMAFILILLFALKIPLFPPSLMASVAAEDLSLFRRCVDTLHHLVLPAIALSLAPAAGVARFMRASLMEVISQDYIRTANAKGLKKSRIIMKHGLRNALLPIITLFGLYLPILFSGSVLVEKIFSWPGMGQLMVEKIFERDYPVVLGTTFFFGVTVVMGNLLADILYTVADPRIRVRK